MESITNVPEFVRFVVDRSLDMRSPFWWRGQSQETWGLLPGVFRGGRMPQDEMQMSQRFVAGAGVRGSDGPRSKEWHEWLLLMQHYSVPTRLLDWSESPLVALFFACETDDHTDGRVFSLEPNELNLMTRGRAGLPMPLVAELRDMFMSAFQDSGAVLPAAVALAPIHAEMRMFLQRSTFTVQAFGVDLSVYLKDKDCLRSYTVPAGRKVFIREELDLLGVSRSTLFFDLDNLARDIAGMYFPGGRAPPPRK